ncbi:MAG: ATP-binding protein [Deltaproteobacteria bacterium]|nr:ATP-binding protein [Deltaproteobacteria bacterium]
MDLKRVNFIIDSDIQNVPLIGMSVNKLCLSASFSTIDAFNIELCVVEAITNSIRHSYSEEIGHEVKVVFTLTQEDIVIDICDTGPSMDPDLLDRAVIQYPEGNDNEIETIAEGGRGLGIIKEIMDSVVYRSEIGENCLSMRKRLPGK